MKGHSSTTVGGWRWKVDGVVLKMEPPLNADPGLNPVAVDLRMIIAVTPCTFQNGETGSGLWVSPAAQDFFGVRLPYHEAVDAWMTANGLKAMT